MRYIITVLFIVLSPIFTKSATHLNPETFWEHVTYGSFDLPEITVRPTAAADIELLARLLYSECGLEPDLGILLVGCVVDNRMRYKNKSLHHVIYERGQFDGVRKKHFKDFYKYSYPAAERNKQRCREIAKLVLKGFNILPIEVQYYANECASTDRNWINHISQYTYVHYNNHTFYYTEL